MGDIAVLIKQISTCGSGWLQTKSVVLIRRRMTCGTFDYEQRVWQSMSTVSRLQGREGDWFRKVRPTRHPITAACWLPADDVISGNTHLFTTFEKITIRITNEAWEGVTLSVRIVSPVGFVTGRLFWSQELHDWAEDLMFCDLLIITIDSYIDIIDYRQIFYDKGLVNWSKLLWSWLLKNFVFTKQIHIYL